MECMESIGMPRSTARIPVFCDILRREEKKRRENFKINWWCKQYLLQRYREFKKYTKSKYGTDFNSIEKQEAERSNK